ncbi:TonB-dependent receptor [Tenacibaculum sp. E3R01]|uniref:TonB-dependent receptor domain-containing protein n=1 Tax=Tenacibaculum sp. E3R01 TaxID=2267227 RepID=UPI000DE93D02|nr:TonB-dependent receptor [Tenacibaculum sp. E3R01]RBW63214.1 TonB-dependent receptor [Tenacibaculum sp. E3R01]
MKKILLLLLTILSINTYAQMPKSNLSKPGSVYGKVIDQTTKEPLPYVNIIIKDVAKKIITGGITNENGIFTVKNIPEGNSIVEIQFIGYKTINKPIAIKGSRKKINLGTISLLEDATTLDEVEVRAETSTVTQKVDRKVINVGKDLTSAGATASELLNNVQSVSVDSQTGNISLRGNDNVRVLVDGKPTNISAAQLLQQIPSSSIKSIELITNPSAKYNPEGMSGIINIILNKKANMGFNGSINTGVEAGHYVRYNGSLDMNYKTGNVNFFANYGTRLGKRHNYGYVNRTSPQTINQNFVFDNDNTSHLLKVGADIYINDKNTLSVYTTQNWFDGLATGSTMVRNNGVLLTNAPTISNSESNSSAYNFNYKLDFDKKGHNIEFEANFSNSKSPEVAVFNELINPSDKSLNYNNSVTNNRDNTLLNLDYTNPVSKNGKLELGAEVRINKTSNSIITNQENLNNSSFNYDRNIFSSYITYSHKFNKITMQIGARLEQYEIEGDFVNGTSTAKITDDIFTVYPSAFFTYNPSDKNQFQLSYSRRVDRPGIGQLNPIREWSTPLITSIGEPTLRPQFTNSFEVNYTRRIKGGSLTFGTFYRKINDNISRLTYKDPLDTNVPKVKQILSFINFPDNDAYGLEFSANYRIAKWWRANASLDFYSQSQKGIVNYKEANERTTDVKTNVFNSRISNSFTATKNLRFQLFAMYRGGQDGIQFNSKSMWMINTGASLRVLKGKGNLTLRVNDIFKGMRFAFDAETPFTQNGQFNWESQSAYIGFNYRFGGGKNKAKSRRRRDSNEKQGSGGFI